MSNLLEKASIIHVPAGYDVGSINSVKPSESPFADFTFDRGTSATQTRTESDGDIATVGQDIPRLDYSGGVGHWLIEPQSTNLVDYSEDFTRLLPTGNWDTQGDITITDGFSSPDGGNNASKVSTNSPSTSLLYNNYQTVNRLTDSRSIWAKTVSGTGQLHLLSHNSNASSLFTITEEWQRFDLTGYNTTGANSFYAVDFRGSSTLTEVYLWGGQAEDNPFATSYIPTNGGTVTRDPETAINSGHDGLFGQTEGVLYAEIAALDTSSLQRIIQLSDSSSSTAITISFNSDGNFVLSAILNNTVAVNSTSTPYNAGQFYKIAIKYESGNSAIWIDGVENVPSSTTYNPIDTINKFGLEAHYAGADFYGKVKCLAVFKEALSDAELQCLTTTSTNQVLAEYKIYVERSNGIYENESTMESILNELT